MNVYNRSAQAEIHGSEEYPKIKGYAKFTVVGARTLVTITVSGLPHGDKKCAERFFALHIHGGGSCTGNNTDPFADAGMHYNPDNCPHPAHAGDLPPLLSVNGKAAMSFLTGSFTPSEIIGKTIVIHSAADDFTTQPAGNSGMKIACGEIEGM